jgi:hypothetical protein
MVLRNGAQINLNGGTIEGDLGSKIVLSSETGIIGSGTITNTELQYPGSALFLPDVKITLQGSSVIACAGTSSPEPYITILGYIRLEPEGGEIRIDDCFEEIRLGAQSYFIAQGPGSVTNAPTINMWDESTVQFNGQDQLKQLEVKFRSHAELNVYSTFQTNWSSLGGDYDPILGKINTWDGIQVVGSIALVNMEYTTVKDIYMDPYYSGTGVHLYQASNRSNVIDNCWITHDANGSKEGDGVFLQPGGSYSNLTLKCTELYSDWYTAITAISSDIAMARCTISNAKRGVAAYTLNSTFYIVESTIQNCLDEGLYGDHVDIQFTNGGFFSSGYNRIINNGLSQIYLKNSSSLLGGYNVPGLGLCGHNNTIGHYDQYMNRVFIEDASCTAVLWGNYWMSPYPISSTFVKNGSICDYSQYYSTSQVPASVPNCVSMGKIGIPISAPLSSVSRENIAAHARVGNMHSIYGFAQSQLSHASSYDEKINVLDEVLDAFSIYSRQFMDSLQININRWDRLLGNVITSVPSTYAPTILALKAKKRFLVGDMDSCYSLLQYLGTQYTTSEAYVQSLIVKLSASMALDDSIKVRNSLNEIDVSLLSQYEKSTPRNMTRAYLRTRHSGGMPKTRGSHVEIKEGSSVSFVYPTPADKSVSLDYHSTESCTYYIAVFDRSGVKVTDISGYMVQGDNTVSMDCSGYDPGTYFYQLRTVNDTLSGKFIVLH